MDNSDSEDDSHNSLRSIKVRKARLPDVNAVTNMYNNSFDFLDNESREWIESVIRKRSRRVRLYVADENGKILGFALVYKRRNRAYIDALAVDPEHRGRGIGSYILSHIENILVNEGVERIYLTVKNGNYNALGMYIKNGYRVSGVVLILEAISRDIRISERGLSNVMVKIGSIKEFTYPRTRFIDLSIWDSLTWDIDDVIYRVSNEDALVMAVYKNRKLLGIARIYMYKNRVFIERLALSFYRPTEVLKTIMKIIKTKLPQEKMITVSIDSTKSSLLKTLIMMGFKVVNSEYILYKNLINNNQVAKSYTYGKLI